MRLIDADEALRMVENSRKDNPFFNGKTTPIWEAAHDSAISCVAACPTIDAVPVVRCKDCKHRGTDYCIFHINGEPADEELLKKLDNDFCSYGERRDENG